MTYPKRIRLSRRKGWRLPEGTVNISRPGPWGNPFVAGKDGNMQECVHLHRLLMAGYLAITAKADLELQRRAFRHAITHITELEGRDVACWCHLDAWCHGDTLLAAASGPRPTTWEERYFLRRIQANGENGLEVVDWRGNELATALVKSCLIWAADRTDGETSRLRLSTIGIRALEREQEALQP